MRKILPLCVQGMTGKAGAEGSKRWKGIPQKVCANRRGESSRKFLRLCDLGTNGRTRKGKGEAFGLTLCYGDLW